MARCRIQASDRAGPIGRDHRHPREREFERHGAGFGQRRVGDPECRALVLLRRPRPAARPASSSRPRGPSARKCGMVGRTGSNAMPSARSRPSVAPKTAMMMPDLAAAASRQHQQNRRLPVPALLLGGSGPQRGDLLDQGMTDIAAGRPAQPAVLLRFERQQGQDMVDITAALRAPGPAATPRPKETRSR